MPSSRATGVGTTLGDLVRRVHALEQRVESAHPENASVMAERMMAMEASCREHVNSTVALQIGRGKAINEAMEKIIRDMSAAEGFLGNAAILAENRLAKTVTKVETSLETMRKHMKDQQDVVDGLRASIDSQTADMVFLRGAHATIARKCAAADEHIEQTFAAISEQGEKTEEMYRMMQKEIVIPMQARGGISPSEFLSRQALLQGYALDNTAAAIKSAQNLARPRSLSIDRKR